MQCTKQAKMLLGELSRAGFSSFLVGGCVRDSLMGMIPHDEDITTSAKPEEVMELFSSQYKVVETGMKHGTVTVLVDGIPFEITTMRTESGYDDNRHPNQVSFVRDVVEDLSRRDFTINAIAWNADGLVDPFEGQRDLNEKVIRAVGDPNQRFQEDALRVMRAVRFQAQFGFSIDSATREAIINHSHLIQNISKERIRDEMTKILVSSHPECFGLLHDYGLLPFISEEIDHIFGCEQNNDFHCYDVGGHTLVALENIEPDLVLRTTMLLHDVGKPICKVQKNGRDHFYRHPEVSARIAEAFLKEYRFTNKDIRNIVDLIQNHDMLGTLWESRKPDKKIRRFLLEHHDKDDQFFLNFIKVKRADYLAHNLRHEMAPLGKAYLDHIEETIRKYVGPERLPRQIKELAIDGHDILAEGVQPKHVKAIQLRLLRIVLDKPEQNTKEALKSYVKTEYKQLNHQLRTSRRDTESV